MSPSPVPPPPPGSERRRHARCEVWAQIEVTAQGEVAVLPVRDLSMGGVYVEVGVGEVPGIRMGAKVQIYLQVEGEAALPSVEAAATVVRVDLGSGKKKSGFALMWNTSDPAIAKSLALILERTVETPKDGAAQAPVLR